MRLYPKELAGGGRSHRQKSLDLSGQVPIHETLQRDTELWPLVQEGPDARDRPANVASAPGECGVHGRYTAGQGERGADDLSRLERRHIFAPSADIQRA